MPTSEKSWDLGSYEDIVQNMVEGVVVEDNKGCLIFVNPAVAKLLGYERKDLVGQHWTLTVPSDQRPVVLAANARRKEGHADRYQLDMLHRNGTRLPVLVSSNPRFEPDTGRFAGSVAVLTDIRNQVHAQSELQQRTDLLTTLYEASQIFLGQIDSKTILESICRLAVERFDLEMAWVGMIANDSSDIRPAAVHGDRDGYLGSIRVTWDDNPAGQGPTGRAIRTRQPVVTRQIDSDPNFQMWRNEATRRGYRSSAALPLLSGQRVLGTLNVYSRHLDDFSEEQIQVLQSLANQAATALENARLYEETQHHNRELLLLNRVIAASVHAGQDVSTFLETVCQELAETFDSPQSGALLVDDERATAKVMAEYCVEERPLAAGMTFDVANHPPLLALLEGQPLLHISIAEFGLPEETLSQWLCQQATGWLLFLPLLIEGETIGCLGLASSRPRPFSTQEVDLARRVAEQVSGVLARIRLAEAQQQLSIAVEQAAESTVITDPKGNILYVNPAFDRINGYERSEAVGQNILSLRTSQQNSTSGEGYCRALNAGRAWQGRLTGKRRDGTSYTEEATITPVRNSSGEVVSYIATMRDVTREIQLEEQFYRAQKMEAIGRLAGGIAHDFNNLLTIIHLTTRLLERGMRPEDPLWNHVKRIRESGDRATQLVKQLLTFSRKEVVQSQELDLNRVLGDLGSMLQRIIGEDIKLKIELADDLWPVSVDPSQMEQVIMNLVVNARDAMPEGGALTVETSNVVLDTVYAALHVDAQPGEYVQLTVSDTGMGMDQEVKSHLFEPFFTTKERGKGTGLGLATIFGIVKQSGGHIQVYSEVGYGTTFRLYLPRANAPAASSYVPPMPERRERGDEWAQSPAPQKPQRQGRKKGANGDRQTILLVEDEQAVRELAVQILESQGYQILPARDGAEALEASAQYERPIHLLLTDVVMPRLSGQELAEALQEQRPGMRVLYTSGYNHDSLGSKETLGKDTAFLCKPLTVAGLIDAVRNALEEST